MAERWIFEQAEEGETYWTRTDGRYQIAGYFTEDGEAHFNVIEFLGTGPDPDFVMLCRDMKTLAEAESFIRRLRKPTGIS